MPRAVRRKSGVRGNTGGMWRFLFVPAAIALAAGTAGCGSSSHKAAQTPPTTTAATTTAATTTSSSPGALQAEATAIAAGDIPDNQVFLVFRNGAARYSMKYPEGWAQQGAGKLVTFRDKNNIVRIVVAAGGTPTTAAGRADVGQLHGVHVASAPHTMTLGGSPAVKVTYSTVSAPNAVTGKRVKLVVNRYYLAHGGRRAVIDLGTPVGVDNVDAYRLMVESFRWS